MPRRTAMNDPALLPEAERPAARAAGAEQIPVGRLVNDSEVLLHGDGSAGAWQRLSTRDALMAEDELIALPTFRPGVAPQHRRRRHRAPVRGLGRAAHSA